MPFRLNGYMPLRLIEELRDAQFGATRSANKGKPALACHGPVRVPVLPPPVDTLAAPSY